MQIQLQNPRTGNWEFVNISEASAQQLRGPQPAPTVVRVPTVVERSHSGHPLLILGVVIGALFGLIACLPPKIRGWVVLGLIAGIIWLCWRSNTDKAQAYAGTNEPVAAEHHPYSVLEHNPDAKVDHYSDYAPRAELVRLPNK